MAKFLLFSDLHCNNYAQFAHVLPSGRNSRLADCLSIITQAKTVACERACDAVLILGDLFHSRTKIDVDVYSAAWLAIRELSEVVPVVLLKGNHDSHNKIGDTHSLEAFAPISRVVDKPARFELSGCSFVAEPYTPDVGDLIQRLRVQEPADVLLLHQAIREGSVGPYGGITGHGDLGLADLSLDKWRFVFAGDFHKKQTLANGKFRYCGSPLQLNFGETGEPKEFCLLDTQSWTVEDIPTSAPRFFVFDTPMDYMLAKEESTCVASSEGTAAALAQGCVRPDIDFIRVLYVEDLREAAEAVKTDCDRIQIVEESEQKAVLQRVGNEVASNDNLLLEAYIASRAGVLDRDRLMAVGLEELLGASD